MASLTKWTSLSRLWEMVMGRGTWYAAVSGFTKSQTQLSDWITTKEELYVPKWFIYKWMKIWVHNMSSLCLKFGTGARVLSCPCFQELYMRARWTYLFSVTVELELKTSEVSFFFPPLQITTLDFVEIFSLTWILISWIFHFLIMYL